MKLTWGCSLSVLRFLRYGKGLTLGERTLKLPNTRSSREDFQAQNNKLPNVGASLGYRIHFGIFPTPGFLRILYLSIVLAARE